MGFIYAIYYHNKPVYVGQTIKQPELRRREHWNAAKAGRGFKIHHYMRELGIENFTFKVLEQTRNLNEREVYWIEKLNTHCSKGGCNLTVGGFGGSDSLKRICYQYDLEGQFLKQFESVSAAAREVKGNHENILKVLYGQLNTAYGYRWSYDFADQLGQLPNNYTGSSKKVGQYSLDGELIQTFESTKEAARFLNKSQGNISLAASGKRKTAYGYKWLFI